jgi:hypothetical protein
MQAREEAERAERHRRRVVILAWVLVLGVFGLGGGALVYAQRHGAFETRVVREVVHEVVRDDSYDFMKGVEIALKVDPPAARPRLLRRARRGQPADESEEVTNLGDAASDGGDETLAAEVVQGVMTRNLKSLVECVADERRRDPGIKNVAMDFVIRGSGDVSSIKVNGKTGTPIAGCMNGKMREVAFPKFNGSKTHASFSLALR